jgi:hypothetical protein
MCLLYVSAQKVEKSSPFLEVGQDFTQYKIHFLVHVSICFHFLWRIFVATVDDVQEMSTKSKVIIEIAIKQAW